MVGSGEACDGNDFAGVTCESMLGPNGVGALSCTATCTIDASACIVSTPCGDTSGVQVGSPWPMFRRCSTGISRGADRGPKRPKIAWSYPSGNTNASDGLAVAADGTVYWADGGALLAITADGSTKWKLTLPCWGSPAIGVDGTIFVTGNGGLAAVSAEGSLLWTVPLSNGSLRSPVIGAGGTVLIALGELTAVSPQGKVLWHQPFDQPEGDITIGQDETIFVAGQSLSSFAPDGTPKSVEMTATVPVDVVSDVSGELLMGSLATLSRTAAHPDGTFFWTTPVKNDSVTGISLAADGMSYWSQHDVGTFLAVRLDGTVAWQTSLGAFGIGGSIVDADGMIFTNAHDPATGRPIAVFDPAGHLVDSVDSGTVDLVTATMVLGTQHTLYLVSEDTLYAVRDGD